MIHRSKFQNFKALRDVEVTFDSRLTVLVGPNGSGKTSVLQGIHYLTQLAREHNADPEFQFANLPEYRSAGCEDWEAPNFGLCGRRDGEADDYEIGVAGTDEDASALGLVTLGTSRVIAKGVPSGAALKNVEYFPRPQPRFGESRFDNSAILRFSARRLALPALARSQSPQIEKDGFGLATTLSHVKSKYPKQFEQILAALRRVIPNVTDVRFDKEHIPNTDYFGDVLLLDYKGAQGIKASHVSSGTLFALGLLTVALGPGSPNVILLDDLDNGLHPKAQMELIEVFRELLKQNAELQIIATSHSPYILDRLEWNEVRVTSLGDDGAAVCKPLTAHPDFERWKDSMSPGEFWGTFYEDWLNKPRNPQPVA